jgi:sterol desaturase/sphingolipid hydroxylase (fatty acid hydroxylase superfamily)
MIISKTEKDLFLIGVLILLYILECIFPYYKTFHRKARHAFRNVGLISINAVLFNLALMPAIIYATSRSWGLLHRYELDWKVELGLTILTIDLLTYVLHVLFHLSPFLWRFHRMHHSDTEMDVTSGSRFHIGEHTITTAVRCAIYAGFGMEREFIVLYEAIFIANVLFHHANLSMGDTLDRIYRVVFTSPDMHKVHHSNIREEHDSNYTSLLSVWDRLFGTFQISDDASKIVYGIQGFDDEQTIRKMFMTPIRPVTSKDGDNESSVRGL